MKGDFSRFRFNVSKGYTGVLQQQGRVTLDADWNEQVRIQADLDRKRLHDVIGPCGVPYGEDGFLVSIEGAGSDYNLNLTAGTIYVAGHRIGIDAPEKYSPQPFLPDPESLSDPGDSSRVDLVYLCVRERHITYLEDEKIREVALGGPDTTTRVQTIWQVRVHEGVSLAGCGDDAEALMEEAGVGGGLLTTLKNSPDTVDENPCVTPVDSTYRGLENRLYRVEVHAGGRLDNADGASVKWSRYNGAVAFEVSNIYVTNRILTLARLGWDQVVTLKPSSWIELVSEEDELAGRPGEMLQISAEESAINDAQRQVSLKDVDNINDILNDYSARKNVKVRLWDSNAIVLNDDFDATTNTTEITLGDDGVLIRIGVNNLADLFRTGDYWTFTARTITGSVDELIEEPPQGPEYHCCKLALIHWNPEDGETHVEDCRPFFPALSEMLQLHYVGGDGQEGKPGDTLPGELMVRVSRGDYPVEDVTISFQIDPAGEGGQVSTNADPTGGNTTFDYTDGDGLARCTWQLDSNRDRYHQRVVAWIDIAGELRSHQQVIFSANLSIAEEVSYNPPAGCINIDGSVGTVAEALNDLCSIGAEGVAYSPPAGCINIDGGGGTVADALNDLCSIGADGVTYTPPAACTNLGDATTVSEALEALCSIDAEGVTYTPPDACPNLVGATNVAEALSKLCNISGSSEADPGFHVTAIKWLRADNAVHDQIVPLDLFIGGLRIECDKDPDPASIKQASVFITLELPTRTFPGTQLSYILEGDVGAEGTAIIWTPTERSVQFLTRDIARVVNGGGIFLARLFLKGSKIWLQDQPEIHLNGDVVTRQNTAHNLLLPSGDGEEGGTFEMWFNLDIVIRESKIHDIFIVGVLFPKNLMGLETTRNVEGVIEIDRPSAINLRLNALDLAYPHQKVIADAEIEGYTASDTAFNRGLAISSLVRSGIGEDVSFEVRVLVEDNYDKLVEHICDEWNSTFGDFSLSFSPLIVGNGRLLTHLSEGFRNDELPDIVICDHEILSELSEDVLVGEPAGIIRRPYHRRV